MKGVEPMNRWSGEAGGGRSARMRAFTLTEILVAVAIIALLAAIASVGLRAVTDSAKKTSAATGMRLVAAAIDEYSRFWPAPQGRATAGFPEWDFSYLWTTKDTLHTPTSSELDDPNNPNYDRDVSSKAFGTEPVECLAYSLLATRGGGPYLKTPPSDMVQSLGYDFQTRLTDLGVTTPPALGLNQPVQRLLDPWGTPYVYQWLDVADKPITDADRPVAPGQVWPVAVKYRLICAGPNKKFGNVGPGTTVAQQSEAADNIYVGPAPKPTDTWKLFP